MFYVSFLKSYDITHTIGFCDS